MLHRRLPIATAARAPARTERGPNDDTGRERGWETIDVRTADGWSLRTDIGEPGGVPVGTAVLAHALMARRIEFDRPRGQGLAHLLLESGWRVVTFDFRGHGDSAPPGRRGAASAYDDLVFADLPAVFSFAVTYGAPARPAVLVGHSLGGHVGLAAQGAGLVDFDAFVTVASDVWLRELEPSAARWLVKRATLRAARAICDRVGRFPSRALRLGSDDETAALMGDFERYARTGFWLSADGRTDYLASLARVRVPVLQIVSDGDRLQCPPECGARFVARCGGPHEVLRVTGDGGAPPPTHMGLVLDHGSPYLRRVWDRVRDWMERARTGLRTGHERANEDGKS
ncbi:MAG TPA: alpha/beta fold hydrolase [Polyangiaceae bacterium]|jgi:predicted alpha/beta hydrolase